MKDAIFFTEIFNPLSAKWRNVWKRNHKWVKLKVIRDGEAGRRGARSR